MVARKPGAVAGGVAMKTSRRKTSKLKSRKGVTAVRHYHSSAAELRKQLDQRTRERDEAQKHLADALEQQTATAEVLRAISGSPGELQLIFDAILTSATRLCEANFGILALHDGDGVFRGVGRHNLPLMYARRLAERSMESGFRPHPLTNLGRAAATLQVVHTLNYAENPAYKVGDPIAVDAVELGGIRTLVTVPMLKQNTLIGAIIIFRQQVKPFTEKQIALIQNFASQAVIAIENARLFNELRESLQQQTATADVLKVISRSTFDLQVVLDTLVESAARLCEADLAGIHRKMGSSYQQVATHGYSEELKEYIRTSIPMAPGRGTIVARTVLAGEVVHVVDVLADRELTIGEFYRRAGIRTALGVPLLREGRPIGLIFLARQTVRPFTEKQIELATTFADQAVIAIENARLLNELRESLQQQTATAEVLQVISNSSGELKRVFQATLANATKLCEAGYGGMFLCDGDGFRSAALHGDLSAIFMQQWQQGTLFRPHVDIPLVRAVRTRKAVHVIDLREDPAYLTGDPLPVAAVDVAGIRTMIAIPMLKENEAIGAITVYRQEVRPFTDKQIELVNNFAKQAVIAIENTRLLNELRQRTNDLGEALTQQTATSEVLRIIGSSPGELGPVFECMLANAIRLCEAKFGNLFLHEEGIFRAVAVHAAPAAYAESLQRAHLIVVRDNPGIPLARIVATKEVVHILDLSAEQAYLERNPRMLALVDLARARTLLSVPMLKENELIGAIVIYRQEVRPFSEQQIALIVSFASQAVIAIENTRLLNELRESLQQQTATADVLKVISRSAFDLQVVLDTLLNSAIRLCGTARGMIFRYDGQSCRAVAVNNLPPEFLKLWERTPVRASRGTTVGRALLECRAVQIADVRADPDYAFDEAQKMFAFRTVLAVPMLREGIPKGVIALVKTEVEPFSDKQIALVETFADQAAIAIENVRLFDEIQDKSRQLAEASQHKSQFLANMSHELRTPLNAILGYNQLMLNNIYGKTPERMRDVLTRVQSNGKHLLRLINDVLDLSKIEAGQLTLSPADYSIKRVVQNVSAAVEPLVSEKRLGFKIEVPSDLPPGRADERRLTQVLLNLVSNAIKFTEVGEVMIKVSAVNGEFIVSVRDTGPGIDPVDQARIFEEFQQADSSITKKKGGTGLGLSIARRIIEMHGGRIWVESSIGTGATFSFALPVRAG
jgi:GAF domain-containing protein